MSKSLNSLQLQAAELVARGATESEIASICGKSRSWVQALKRRADFLAAVDDALHKAKEIITEQTERVIISDLEQFRIQFRHAANLLYASSTAYLEKLKQRIDTLNIEEISTLRLAQSLKGGADSMLIALQVGQAALGIEDLARSVDELEKIGEKRVNGTNGHRPISAEIEVN